MDIGKQGICNIYVPCRHPVHCTVTVSLKAITCNGYIFPYVHLGEKSEIVLGVCQLVLD